MSDAIKLKVLPAFPAQVTGRAGVDVTIESGNYYIDLDYTDFPVLGALPTSLTYGLIFDPATGNYAQLPVSLLGGAVPSDASPVMDSVAAPGVSTLYSRGDHVHPTDTSRAAVTAIREKLTANRQYFVRLDGNNANNGLSNSAGGAFATIQKAIDTVIPLDLAGFGVTITVVGNGTYTAGFALTVPFVGGQVIVIGDTTTPANVTIQPASGGNGFTVSNPAVNIHVAGFKFLTSGGGIACYANDGGTLYIDNKVEFGACSQHISAARGGVIQIANGVPYTISGGANYHINLSAQSRLIANINTVTATGTPAFAAAFTQVTTGSIVQQNGTTFSGAATGTRCLASSAGGIDCAGAFTNATYGLGSVNGTITAPGYLI